MSRLFVLFVIGVVNLAAGCSQADLKRTGYETIQNIRQLECDKAPSIECEERERLEVYEERRQEVRHAD